MARFNVRLSSWGAWWILGVVCLAGFGITANPYVFNLQSTRRIVLAAEPVLAALWLFGEVFRARRRERALACACSTSHGLETPSAQRHDNSGQAAQRQRDLAHARPSRWMFWIVLTGVAGLWLVLYRERLCRPLYPIGDDQQYLEAAQSWHATRSNLLTPYNEHIVVSARITTFGAVVIANMCDAPIENALSATVLVLYAICSWLVFLVGRATLGSDLGGLRTVVLFTYSSTYREVLWWYSAGQWITSLIILLFVLLAVRRYCERGGGPLALVCLLSFLAPLAYSISVVTGPIASLWLLVWHRDPRPWQRIVAAVSPSLAAFAGIALTLPILSDRFAAPGYAEAGGRGPEQFAWVDGLALSTRMLTDGLVLRSAGVTVPLSETASAAAFVLLIAAATLLLRRQERLWRYWPCLAMIAMPYLATMPFRSWAGFLLLRDWGRYHLFPQFGLALWLAAALSEERDVGGESKRGITVRQALVVAGLAMLLFAVQWGKTTP